MAGVGIAGAGIVAAAGHPLAAAGVLAGMPVGMLNYWLILAAVRRSRELPPAEANRMVLRRTLGRMALAGAALLLAVRGGPEFLLGVLGGLILEVLTYLGEATRLAGRPRREG